MSITNTNVVTNRIHAMRIVDDEEVEVAPPAAVEMGVVEKNHVKLEWLLPISKAGGTPEWLNPVDLPSGKSCLCDICGQPLKFLLQIYVPLETSTYHRSLFVFMCTSMPCLVQHKHQQRNQNASRSIKVFRCQVTDQLYARRNEKPAAPLCSWCRTWKGDELCGNCKSEHYCSKTHQVRHWSSNHGTQCRTTELAVQPSVDIPQAAASTDTWPEFLIISECEAKYVADIYAQRFGLPDYNQVRSDAQSRHYFLQRIAQYPSQVIRYSRDLTSERAALWPMLSGRPSRANIPKCTSCGGDRAFEFQILLPQLFHLFEVHNDSNSLDWATVVVYTCEASCDGARSYEEEFSWVQLAP